MARIGLMTHPKFRRLVSQLGEPIAHCRGYLECLWDVGYDQADPKIGTAKDIGLACQYPGDFRRIARILSQTGFIERLDGFYFIHDLYEHAPDYVKKRWKRSKFVRQTADSGRQTADNGRQTASCIGMGWDGMANTPLAPQGGEGQPSTAPEEKPKRRRERQTTAEVIRDAMRSNGQ